jgi:acetylxylan esterase
MKFHLDYFEKFGNEAADWVVARAKNASAVPEVGSGTTSGASDMLRKGISHPLSNVFILFIVLFVLYFAIKRIAVWKFSSPRYAPVSTTEAV